MREWQYADAGNLSARQSLWAQRPGRSTPAIWLDALALDGTEAVLDVGGGNGAHLGELRRRGHQGALLGVHQGALLGVDLSPGMAHVAAATGAGVAVADATRLPVGSGAVDAALAMHMRYHVPDVPA